MKNSNITSGSNAQEHILVCLSASPSNAKIVKTAATMASAFGGSFTALYVQTPDSDKLDEENKNRLQDHIRLAEQLGADIATAYGEDVSFQIAEYARISGVTKIVIGRSNIKRRHFWNRPTLTDKLTEIAPNLDIHIIPDNIINSKYRPSSHSLFRSLIPYPKDILITVLILAIATILGLSFYSFGFTDSNIITVYILGVLLTSLFTKGYTCGIIGSLVSVMLFNFFFTEPRLTFHAYDSGYPVTFAIMLVASVITGTLASKLKSHAKLSAQAAFRTKVLLDTNQLLQKAQNDEDIINITATQIMKLLNRSVVMYSVRDGKLTKGSLYSAQSDNLEDLFTTTERNTAEWVYLNKHRAGASTNVYSKAKCVYFSIRINNNIYGVIGIRIKGKPLDAFENSILLSILGECALAMDNRRNAKEKEQTAVLAKNEQLRANLLRAISHDLRTPLTSISGNAGNLLSNKDKLDEDTKMQIYTDIFDDSEWLISLVENLLSVTRIEEGRMNFNKSIELVDEITEEALRHIGRKSTEHKISVIHKDELLLANADAKLIVQVLINLIDNAIKYTPLGSEIKVITEKKNGYASISVIDNGNGIPDNIKPYVFEMFYTGDNRIADSCRSLGLGLALCKSIIGAHGGELTLTDNQPQGCNFTFTLPLGEVKIDE
ncbi:MAG: DUF4118 domain-containing protein [Acutalibacteraceae bacterium]|nr:DUF4118 domain-containing protein [Acutalibacteraceae bacterium]